MTKPALSVGLCDRLTGEIAADGIGGGAARLAGRPGEPGHGSVRCQEFEPVAIASGATGT